MIVLINVYSDCILEQYPNINHRSDGSGSIDRDEFLSIPQIASNPLASRMIAIFDSEYVYFIFIKPVARTPCHISRR